MPVRRNIRRLVAQEMEKHVLEFKPTLDVEPDQAEEVARQLLYIQEPLLKKLRRAQGMGKQTGKILTETEDHEEAMA